MWEERDLSSRARCALKRKVEAASFVLPLGDETAILSFLGCEVKGELSVHRKNGGHKMRPNFELTADIDWKCEVAV